MVVKGRFIAVRSWYLSLPVPIVATICQEDGCILQEVRALVYSWQRVCIPYECRVAVSVANTETQFSVFLWSKHHSACPFHHFGLYQAFFEHLISPLSFFRSRFRPDPTQMLDCLTRAQFQTNVKRNGGDPSQAHNSHAQELCYKSQDVLSYGLFLAAGVHILCSLFWICVRFSGAFLIRTAEFFRNLFFSLD